MSGMQAHIFAHYAMGHAAICVVNAALVSSQRQRQVWTLESIGGGTFFKVRGHKCTLKNYRKCLWLELATVTSQALNDYVITCTPYEGLNYTTMKTYRWTTWNSNRLLQRRPNSSASLWLIMRFILTNWIKPFDAWVTEISIWFHSGWHYHCPVTRREILTITSPLSSNVRHRAKITPQWGL